MGDVWDIHKSKIIVGIVAGILTCIIGVLSLHNSIVSDISSDVDTKIETHRLKSEPRLQVLEQKVDGIAKQQDEMTAEQKEQRQILNEILTKVNSQ
jgi:hypothetical protein